MGNKEQKTSGLNEVRIGYFMGMDKVRFRKPVIPGDQVIFAVQILNLRSKVIKMAGTASVDGQLVAEAELLASIGENR